MRRVTITKTRSEQQEDKTLKSQRLRQKGLKAQHTANTRGVLLEGRGVERGNKGVLGNERSEGEGGGQEEARGKRRGTL